MPVAPSAPTQLPPRPASRGRCTDVIARYRSGDVAVCKAGDEVALHFATTSGEVVVLMTERAFSRGARGPRDHHGNAFRTHEQLARGEPASPEPVERVESACSEPACGEPVESAERVELAAKPGSGSARSACGFAPRLGLARQPITKPNGRIL